MPEWSNVDQHPDSAARASAERAFSRLDVLNNLEIHSNENASLIRVNELSIALM
jgi:hypothetical protein